MVELPVRGHEVLPVVDHRAPVRGRRRDAEAEVAERDDGQDVLHDVGHRVDDRLGDHVGQHVAAHDAQVAGQPAGLGRQHIVLPLGHQDLAADDPRVGHPADERDGDVDAALARAEHEDQGDDQHVEREGDHDVDQPHDDGVDPAAEVAGDAAQDRAEDEREQHGEERDPQVEPARRRAAGDQMSRPSWSVPSRCWALGPCSVVAEVLRVRVVGGDQRRGDGQNDDDAA